MGLGRVERPTSSLSGMRSNQLSYRPSDRLCCHAGRPPGSRPRSSRQAWIVHKRKPASFWLVGGQAALARARPRPASGLAPATGQRLRCPSGAKTMTLEAACRAPAALAGRCLVRGVRLFFLGKEVIQPQVLLRLPCYDFTPVINTGLDACFPCGLAQRLLPISTPMV